MSDYAIGIDLGTSTSEISVFRNNEPYPIPDPSTKSPIVPSLVSFRRNGEIAVGEAARNIAYSERGVREVKRRMGTEDLVSVLSGENEQKKFRPEEISALILKKLKETAEATLNTTIRDVVITVPANFPDAARQATKHAAEIAGLNVIRLINEPTAAALAFGINNLNLEEQMIVFDFGGGTLDITVLEMIEGIVDVKCSFGDTFLGGKDIDDALIELVTDMFKRQHPTFILNDRGRDTLKRPCELAKIELSNQQSAQLLIPNFFTEAGNPVDLDLEVTRVDFERAIDPILEKARICVREALKAKELRPSSIKRVLLVGGSTYIPAVRRMVTEMFGKEPCADVHPDLAVTMGASIQAALAKGLIDEEKGIILTDVIPFSLGVDMMTQVGYQEVLVFDPLIERNQKIPFSVKREYCCRFIDQESVEFHLYQDHSGKARYPEDCEDTGIVGHITDIPHATNGKPHPINVDFSYDIDGLAIVKASIPAINKSVTISYGKSAKRMDDKDLETAKKKVNELWKSNEKAKNFEGIIEKAERLMPNLATTDRNRLNSVLIELKQALTANDDKHIEDSGNRLVDLMYDLE